MWNFQSSKNIFFSSHLRTHQVKVILSRFKPVHEVAVERIKFERLKNASSNIFKVDLLQMCEKNNSKLLATYKSYKRFFSKKVTAYFGGQIWKQEICSLKFFFGLFQITTWIYIVVIIDPCHTNYKLWLGRSD